MKSMSQVQTLSDIKGIHFAGIRSIPKAQRSKYLELYVLDREMDRLEREKFAVDKRKNNTQKRLSMLTTRMAKLQKELHEEGLTRSHRHIIPRKPLKTMSIRY